MANITRIKNNQITDANVVAYAKIQTGTITGNLFAPTVTLNSNLTIVGNLNVSGNSSIINSVNTYVQDPLVIFNNGYTGSVAGYDIGILVNRNLSSLGPYGAVNTAWVWVENDQAFEGITTSTTGNALTGLTSSGFANLKIGNVTSVSQTVTNNLTAGSITNTPVSGSTGYFTTAYAGNFSTGNAVLSGGSITGMPVSGSTGYFTTAEANNFSTGNAVILGTQTYIGSGATPIANVYAGLGYFTNLSAGNVNNVSGTFTTLQATNFSSGNIAVTGGYATGLANVYSTLGYITNFSTANAIIAGGSINNTPIGATTASTGAFTTLSSSTNATLATAVATNFSAANARVTSGYADNFAIGANVAATGSFTTLTTSGVTIHNANVVATSSATSTTTTTGAIVVTGTGGVGVAGNVIAGGQVQAGAGLYSTGTFNGGYTGGTVVDHVSNNGRISVGSGDALTFYTGGLAGTQTAQISSAGLLTVATGIVSTAGNIVASSGNLVV
jgi:hypothetical protein